MNPGYEVQLNPRDPGSTMRSGSANDAFSTIPAAPQLDGEWKLVYNFIHSAYLGYVFEYGFGISLTFASTGFVTFDFKNFSRIFV